jgi:hypothetical protein
MALSAIVKSIRLRHTEDSVAFLLFLHQRFPFAWFRVSRRILIGAAEDGLCVPTQRRSSDWFSTGWRHEAPVIEAVREIARICRTPNWWAQPQNAGHDYVFSWDRAEKIAAASDFPHRAQTFPEQLTQLEQEIASHRPARAIAILCSFDKKRGFKPALLGKFLQLLAERQGNLLAYEVAEIYLRQLRALSADTNFVGQAIYRLACGELGMQEEVEVSDQECLALLEAGRKRLSELKAIPGYLLDGIHSPGKDRRFSGMSSDMAAACRVFTYFGRLDPADKWLTSFRQDGEEG